MAPQNSVWTRKSILLRTLSNLLANLTRKRDAGLETDVRKDTKKLSFLERAVIQLFGKVLRSKLVKLTL